MDKGGPAVRIIRLLDTLYIHPPRPHRQDSKRPSARPQQSPLCGGHGTALPRKRLRRGPCDLASSLLGGFLKELESGSPRQKSLPSPPVQRESAVTGPLSLDDDVLKLSPTPLGPPNVSVFIWGRSQEMASIQGGGRLAGTV